MQEYISDAVVLAKTPSKQLDARYSIFTKRFGKMIAKATSSRKITSKLAGHLEPGSFSRVRIIERGGFQLADALKNDAISAEISVGDLYFLDKLLPENEPEPLIWSLLQGKDFNWRRGLQILGWDPADAECSACSAPAVAHFSVRRQEFFCERCGRSLPARDRISLA